MKICIFYIKKIRSSPFPETLNYSIFLFSLICFLSGGDFAYSQKKSTDSKIFRASVVKVNVTPETPQNLRGYGQRISTGVHDSIYHRIVALDDGKTQFFIVASEFCSLSPGQYDHVAAILNKKFGIRPENFWWSFTHTHSAPEVGDPGLIRMFMPERFEMNLDTAYCALVERKLVEGIAEAREKLEPARLGSGWGFSQANINRRAIDVDGKASLGMNPDGATDRRIGLLRIDRKDGTPIACIANYPLHGTVLGKESFVISGDVPGVVSEYVEKKIGAPVLYINGAAGNLAPLYSTSPDPVKGHLSQFRVLLGDKITDAYQKISSTTDKVTIDARSILVETARKPGLKWPADLGKYTRVTKEGSEFVRLPVRFLKLTEEIAIWSAPIELFCEISNEIRDRSPFPFTFYFGYTNGTFGYMPTMQEWSHEGYETNISVFTPAAATDLTEAVDGYLHGEMKTE